MEPTRLVAGLDDLVRKVAAAETAPDVFRALVEGIPLAAPRAAVFLVRQDDLKGWRCFGYPDTVVENLRGFAISAEHSGARIRPDGEPESRIDHVATPDFGQSAPDESVTVTVAVKGKPIALIVAERRGDEGPWHPEGLSLMARTARLRLELSLAERKSQGQTATPRPTASKPRDLSPAPAKATVPAASPAAPPEDPRVDAARRFARLVATDIRLYNEEAVVLGRRNGDLAQRLNEPINLGRQSFVDRYGDMGPVAMQLLQQALVEVLAGGDPNLLSAAS